MMKFVEEMARCNCLLCMQDGAGYGGILGMKCAARYRQKQI